MLANPRLVSRVQSGYSGKVESFFRDVEEERRFFHLEAEELVEAYLTNPSIDPDTLVALYERATPLDLQEDDKWLRLIQCSADNPVLACQEEQAAGAGRTLT